MSETLKNYLGSQKKNLSDRSNDGDKRKKVKESTLDLSLNQDDADVFSDGFDPPKCELTLSDRLKLRQKS